MLTDRLDAQKTGLEEGLVFDWGGEIANTFHSHRLVHNTYRVYGNAKHLELVFRYASVHDVLTNRTNERCKRCRLYKFYFEQNGNIGNFESLANCAADVGLDRAKTLAFLNSDEDSEETMAGLNASKNIKVIDHFSLGPFSLIVFFVFRSSGHPALQVYRGRSLDRHHWLADAVPVRRGR